LPNVNLCCLSLANQDHIFLGVHRDGNHWAPYWQLDVWLVMYVWDVTDQPPHSQQSCAQWFSSLWPCHLASDTWHQQLLCQDTSLESRYVKFLNISGDCVEVWYVPSATICHVYTKVSRRYLVSKCLSPNFLYSFVVLYLCYGMLYLICHRWTCGM